MANNKKGADMADTRKAAAADVLKRCHRTKESQDNRCNECGGINGAHGIRCSWNIANLP